MKRWGVVRQVFIASFLACASVASTSVVGAYLGLTRFHLRASLVGPNHSIWFEYSQGSIREEVRWYRYETPARTDFSPPDPIMEAPSWSLPASVSTERLGELPEYAHQTSTGWPMLSFAGELPRQTFWGTPSFGPRHVLVLGTLEIPYRPLLPGLLINLVLHSAAWWYVLRVTGYVRRAIVRHRRKDNGLCMNCGYDVYDQPSGSKCPECGEARW